MFEAGTFFILLAIAFIILTFKIPYKEFMYFISSAIFLVLGFMLFTGEAVSFTTIIDDGVNPINQTDYIIGDATQNYNLNTPWLALIFATIGIVVLLIGLVAVISPEKIKQR